MTYGFVESKRYITRTNILLVCVAALLILLIYFYKWTTQANKEFLELEINGADYNALIEKYMYVKGSTKGDDFKNEIIKALSDGLVSRSEYLNITDNQASLLLSVKPEKKQIYETSKEMLIKEIEK